MTAAAINAAVARATVHAPFLAMVMEREPILARQLADGVLPDIARIYLNDADMPVGKRLRIERRRLALVVAIGDLAGVLDLTVVTGALTRFADYALDAAIAAAIGERTPGAEPVGFVAIALGKQGSFELNYSSDIDPILLFDPHALPCRPREAPEDAAVRIARRVVELLQARDGDGYVLRVDLRLRPAAEITPIALPVEAAICHYESQALAWERAAFIRARAAAGDLALGARFLSAIQPFVWRRALDFGAIAEIRGISRRIRDHHAQGQILGPGFDLKRGRGGIREVEFFAQIHQLIHGGRAPGLRAPGTRDALAVLSAQGFIADSDATAMGDAYTLLRTIEHRIQMVDDRQTHSLPTGAALDGLAALSGFDDGKALIAALGGPTQRVAAIYDSLEPDGGNALSRDRVRLADGLEQAGFAASMLEPAVGRVETWRSGSYPALRSMAAREALESVLPTLVLAFGEAPDPGSALIRLDRILARLPSAINLFRLLEARPSLASLLAAILCHAPPLADALGRRPALLDGLIDATALAPIGPVETLAAAMQPPAHWGAGSADYQDVLDHVRRVVGETRFALGVQLISGARQAREVSRDYASLAEAAIDVLAQATITDFERRHGRVRDSELVILALGRLGGGALTHASDLDLIYLFTGDYATESDGKKPLGAVLYYNRLAQRLTAALSVPTASGPLYDIDTRLRPSGAQGPLVVSTEGFARYQRESAWTWEHMALTRARPVFGSTAARAAVSLDIAAVLGGARAARDIVADALAMRAEITINKPPSGPMDVKLLPGGLVDLEFAVHVTQLVHHSGLNPDLGHAIAALVQAQLLPPSMIAAHDFLMGLLPMLRLVAPDSQPPAPATRSLLIAASGLQDWEAVIARLDATRQDVTRCWQQISGG
ncbi:MAG: bifunctional [glutamine synthetase] adenylyltransferase/[glutamine synthetase]-adenylyl-L-tyrosine phosphorylase [Sphingomonas sp.]